MLLTNSGKVVGLPETVTLFFSMLKKNTNTEFAVPIERIESQIYLIRGEKVMLDTDLAALYQVLTKKPEQGG